MNSSEEGNLSPKPFHDESVVNASKLVNISNTDVIWICGLEEFLSRLKEESFALFPRTTDALGAAAGAEPCASSPGPLHVRTSNNGAQGLHTLIFWLAHKGVRQLIKWGKFTPCAQMHMKKSSLQSW